MVKLLHVSFLGVLSSGSLLEQGNTLLDVFSLTPTKCVLFITYLYNVPYICFGVSHAIFKENLYPTCSLIKGARCVAVGLDTALQDGRTAVRSQPAYCTAGYMRVTIPDGVVIQFVHLKMSIVLLETCR